jgi:hypothetical protein
VLEVRGEVMSQLHRNAPVVADKIPHARDIVGFRNILAHGPFGSGVQVLKRPLLYGANHRKHLM